MTSSTLMLLTSAHKNQPGLFPKIIRSYPGSYSWYCVCHTHKPMHSTAKVLQLLLINLLQANIYVSVYTSIKQIFSAHLSSYQFCDILVSLVSLLHTSDSLIRAEVCVCAWTCSLTCVHVCLCVCVWFVLQCLLWGGAVCAAQRSDAPWVQVF